MTDNVIDGKALAESIRRRTAERATSLRERGRPACLAAVLIGGDPSAISYAQAQARLAEPISIEHRLVTLPEQTTQPEAMAAIDRLNADPSVSGIMLHLPVPRPLDGFALQQRIAAAKDVEGVSAANLGLLAMGRDALVPCTAAAAFACLQSTGVDLTGREAVIVGRSVIVGKPLAMLLLAAHATVTHCHTRTRDLPAHTRRAEVLLVAAGAVGLIGAEHVSPGAIVIDVGTNRIEVAGPDGRKLMRTIGDVRFDEVAPVVRAITPVPGGVGPVTVAMLLANTVAAAMRAG